MRVRQARGVSLSFAPFGAPVGCRRRTISRRQIYTSGIATVGVEARVGELLLAGLSEEAQKTDLHLIHLPNARCTSSRQPTACTMTTARSAIQKGGLGPPPKSMLATHILQGPMRTHLVPQEGEAAQWRQQVGA